MSRKHEQEMCSDWWQHVVPENSLWWLHSAGDPLKRVTTYAYVLLQYIVTIVLIVIVNLLLCLTYNLNFIVGMYRKTQYVWDLVLSDFRHTLEVLEHIPGRKRETTVLFYSSILLLCYKYIKQIGCFMEFCFSPKSQILQVPTDLMHFWKRSHKQHTNINGKIVLW